MRRNPRLSRRQEVVSKVIGRAIIFGVPTVLLTFAFHLTWFQAIAVFVAIFTVAPYPED